MKKIVAASVPGLLLLAAVVACEDETATPSFGFDAGGFDGSIPSADGSLPDAAAPDADAQVVPPAVSVTVRSELGPKAGIRVVFNDAQGAVIESKVTGVDGKATHDGSDAVIVSAILVTPGDGDRHHIVTWTGVSVGDNLQLVDSPNEQELGSYTFTLASASPSSPYSVRTPCEDRGQVYGLTSDEYPNFSHCARPTNSIIADSWNENGRAFAFKKGNALPQTGTAAVLSGAWAAGTPVPVTIANLPADPTPDFDDELLEVADGFGFSAYRFNEGHSFWTAAGFGEAHQGSAYFTNDNDYGRRRALSKRVTPGTDVSLDYNQLLPEMTGASFTAANVKRPVLSWEGGATTAADGGIVRIRFHNEVNWDNWWTVIVAPGSTSVTLPAIPDEEAFAKFLPDDSERIETPEVAFFEAEQLPGYREFRNLQGAIVGTFENDFPSYRVPALPTNGSLRVTTWAPALGFR